MGSTDPKGEAGGRGERMPSAADVARIPEPVRAHALVMLQLGAETRKVRRRWTELRELYQAGHAMGFGEIESATGDLWRTELALADAAAIYRAQLAENNARPADSRWSPTVLALWARCSNAGQKPAS